MSFNWSNYQEDKVFIILYNLLMIVTILAGCKWSYLLQLKFNQKFFLDCFLLNFHDSLQNSVLCIYSDASVHPEFHHWINEKRKTSHLSIGCNIDHTWCFYWLCWKETPQQRHIIISEYPLLGAHNQQLICILLFKIGLEVHWIHIFMWSWK